MLLGLTKTGFISFRKQEMFTVHFLRRNPGRSLCRIPVPYKQTFSVLPRNAVFCDKCRHAR